MTVSTEILEGSDRLETEARQVLMARKERRGLQDSQEHEETRDIMDTMEIMVRMAQKARQDPWDSRDQRAGPEMGARTLSANQDQKDEQDPEAPVGHEDREA